MISGVHIEVVLAASYAVFLAGSGVRLGNPGATFS